MWPYIGRLESTKLSGHFSEPLWSDTDGRVGIRKKAGRKWQTFRCGSCVLVEAVTVPFLVWIDVRMKRTSQGYDKNSVSRLSHLTTSQRALLSSMQEDAGI